MTGRQVALSQRCTRTAVLRDMVEISNGVVEKLKKKAKKVTNSMSVDIS